MPQCRGMPGQEDGSGWVGRGAPSWRQGVGGRVGEHHHGGREGVWVSGFQR